MYWVCRYWDVKKYVSRYVVPFYFDYENGGYEKIRKHFSDNNIDNKTLKLPKDGQWLNVGFWENYKSDKDIQAEMDIYSYLPSIFLEEKNADENIVSNLGVSFVYKTRGTLLNLVYRHKEREIAFDLKELGILLCRNGIGFIWYETEFKTEIFLDEYVGFQHEFKELARPYEEKIVKKIGYDQEKKENIYESFCLGKWLSGVIAAEELGIRFWAERKVEEETNNKKSNDTKEAKTEEVKKENTKKILVPDKALLFQYMFIEPGSGQKSENIAFRIANGYDEKYNAPEDINGKLYKPFGNTCFYVSKAGMACVVENVNSNEIFFEGQFSEKFVRDYFFIYLLLSYQSYSCAHYSRLLTKLPADEELFNKQLKYADKLESLNAEINLFLVKSVFESVSNIHHQNGVYRYGKSELCIEDDIRSLTIGLGALEEMVNDKRKQKEQEEKEIEKEKEEKEKEKNEKEKEIKKEKEEKRDQKINLALIVFGFMMIVSAWIDGLNLVDWCMKKGRTINPGHIVISVGIIGLTLYLIITLVCNHRKK